MGRAINNENDIAELKREMQQLKTAFSGLSATVESLKATVESLKNTAPAKKNIDLHKETKAEVKKPNKKNKTDKVVEEAEA